VPSMEQLNLSIDGLNLCSRGPQRARGSVEDDFSMRSCPPHRLPSTGLLKFPTTTTAHPICGASLRDCSKQQQRLRCDMSGQGRQVAGIAPTFVIDPTLRARTRSLENTSM
jgi:hypothetical protein